MIDKFLLYKEYKFLPAETFFIIWVKTMMFKCVRVFLLCFAITFGCGSAVNVATYLSSESEAMTLKNMMTVTMVVDTAFNLPSPHMSIVYDQSKDAYLATKICRALQFFGVKTSLYRLERKNESTAYLGQVLKDIQHRTTSYLGATYLFMTTTPTSEDVVSTIHIEKLGRRNNIYIFLWKDEEISDTFQANIDEVTRIIVITHPKHESFHIYYNQARPDGQSKLIMVNWWSRRKGFYRKPLLPSATQVFKDMNGRLFVIPVIHKPPWHFVSYDNETIKVEGGRDDKLLTIISKKLNFQFEYFDPPDHSEGSAMVNNTMQGVLGLIWQGEVEVFIGDLTVTFERSLVVEFTFFTLSDSEVFLTHAPGRLNEALALVRPFQWEVWPVIVLTIGLSGPLLFMLRKARAGWRGLLWRELCDCVWITMTIFLRQSLVTKIHGDRARLSVIILYLIATYVIGDMYSANLTSLLTRPAREKPVSTLEQLNDAMKNRNFKLLVERHSASHAVFENGSGVYGSIWNKMKNQRQYLLNSTEEGIEKVKLHKNIALVGGRETFFYNAKRYGVQHFHLSERLYTRYSAIAMQMGCPFVDQFNKLIIKLFEGGILSKITENEYQKLGEVQRTKTQQVAKTALEIGEGEAQSEDDEKLKPMSMKTLQGAFYVLLVGCVLGCIAFIVEMAINHFGIKRAAFRGANRSNL